MRTRTWLGIVIPAGIALGLMLGWMTAGGQRTIEYDHPHMVTIPAGAHLAQIEVDTIRIDRWHRAVIIDSYPVTLNMVQSGVPTPWPHFKQSPQGWIPSCPQGQTLIRHYPPPDCLWGTAPPSQKPTQGDMECVYPAQASKLPACPVE